MNIRQRRHMRINTDLPAEIDCGTRNRMSVRILDLSEGGAKIATDREVASCLMQPDQVVPGKIQNLEIQLLFTLPTSSQTSMINARCRALFLARLSQDRFTFGCQFLEIDDKQVEEVATLVKKHVADKSFLLSGV